MIEYLFKVILCSSLFLGFYFFLLQREKMFKFNRAYLLITLFLSLCIPLFFITLPERENKFQSIHEISSGEKQEITIVENATIEENKESENTSNVTSQNVGTKQTQQAILIEETSKHTSSEWMTYFKWEKVLLLFYISIASLLIVKFLLSFFIIYKKVIRSKKVNYNGIFLIINEQKEQLHSFWKYIFIPKQNLNENLSRKELLEHEIAHIKQKHSLDILLIELIKSIFWFNPAFYLYKKAIQLNHEFLADESVLRTKTDVYEYQKLILDSIQVKQALPIASNFNYILTKKRLLMMTKKANSARAVLLQLFSIPFVLVLVYIFSNKVYAQKKSTNELTSQQKEQLKLALKMDDISDYLKDTLVNGSQNYIDTLMIGDKAYIISSPKENLEKIFKDRKNQKVSELPKEEFSKIFKNSDPEEIEKVFAIRELKETDEYKIWKWSKNTNNKDDKSYQYKVIPKNSKDENDHITVTFYNSHEWKKKGQEMSEKGQEISTYFESKEWKDQMEKINEQSEKYNSLEFRKKMEEEALLELKTKEKEKEKLMISMQQEIKKNNQKVISITINNNSEQKNDMDEFREEMRKFGDDMRKFRREMKKLDKN